MRYANAARFRRALEDRLLSQSRTSTTPLARHRKRIAFDRLLARLIQRDPDRWLLKGAIALDYRYGGLARGTRDLDLSHPSDGQSVTNELLIIEEVSHDDYFTFAIQPTSKLDPLGGVAIRFRIRADLAGRRFEDFHVDIGVASEPIITPERLAGSTFLSFADIAPISIPVIAIEQHIAEKVIAYVRTYPGQRRSSRVKDLIDLVLIQSLTQIDADRLGHALDVTFGKSSGLSLPTHFPIPPEYWSQPYRQMATEVGIDPDLAHGHRVAAAFLDPILSGAIDGDAIWVPQERAWLVSK